MAAESAERSELFAFLDRLPSPALLAGDDGIYVHANPAACALVDRSIDEVRGRTIKDLVAEDFDFASAWAQFLREGAQHGEIELRLADGSARPVEFSAVRDFAAGFHLSVLNDLTMRKRLEANIRRTEELYARAFNGTPAPTNIRKLSNGVFVEVNQAFTDALGYWRSDVVGRTAQSLGLWADRKLLTSVLHQVEVGEGVVRTRATLVAKDRSVREFSIALQRTDISGEPHAIVVYTDMETV
jgi:PAS domain S-box-containing protein